jgi:hypothetical protein
MGHFFGLIFYITDVAQNLCYFFDGKRLTKNGLVYILGDIFKNSSDHPDLPQKLRAMENIP